MRVYLLLLLIPVALGLDYAGANPILVFLTSAAAIVPLTVLIGKATENLSAHLGETTGGLLNATMGNVPEMIISISALRQGLQTVVKASLTGSILGNVLLILGISLLGGGARFNTQRYNAHLAGVHSKLLILAVIGLIVPALFHFTSGAEERISIEIASILFITYLAGLAFTLITHRQLFIKKEADGPLVTDQRAWGVGKALTVMIVTAVVLSITSEVLTGAVGPTARMLHLNPVFAGIFLLATVGNMSELLNAVRFARRDNLDLTLSVTMGASTQVALLVAPVLVFAGAVIGSPMDLLFSPFEVVAIGIAAFIGRTITMDGESNWLEGLLLIAVYAMLGFGFYHMKVQ